MNYNVDLAKVVFTNIDTPTPWASTTTTTLATQETGTMQNYEKKHEPRLMSDSNSVMTDLQMSDITQTTGAMTTYTGGFGASAVTSIDMSATRTLSIVYSNTVIATFTAVGTSASLPQTTSPGRGLRVVKDYMPTIQALLISVLGGIFCFCIIRAFMHGRIFERQVARDIAIMGRDEDRNNNHGGTSDGGTGSSAEGLFVPNDSAPTSVSRASSRYTPRHLLPISQATTEVEEGVELTTFASNEETLH
ncbi:hypothetical protein H072_6300 [Dactylellina haptotyla CBS 200.50]|uniref:Uncharacterized protein n=1 Tax=Dactylellina haptotyla (strain CBS 200.50) TaxID=1284197 RepID=S8BKK4_DACHA|nr:hypothetical protein H072_6300 [Dactylellina haptotyla CBS 200.50]